MSRVASRPGYDRLTAYSQEAPQVEVDLSDNTNLFGSAPSALESLAQWGIRTPSRYPTVTTRELRDELSSYTGARVEEIVTGCGSNDVIDAAFRALGAPGTAVAHSSPTFVMGPHFATANSLVPIPVPTRADGAPDIDGLLATGAPIIYLASPNNPSGRAATAADLRRLLDRAPGVVIVDEAYIEYAGGSVVAEAPGRGNVLVTRTFSKAWGLAGLRVGYGVASAPLIAEIEKARGPYKVNAVAERAATAALRQDRTWLGEIVERTIQGRERLVRQLADLGIDATGSSANFVAVPVADGARFAAALAERGVAVRAYANLLRVTIGPEPMMARFVDAFAEVSRCG